MRPCRWNLSGAGRLSFALPVREKAVQTLLCYEHILQLVIVQNEILFFSWMRHLKNLPFSRENSAAPAGGRDRPRLASWRSAPGPPRGRSGPSLSHRGRPEPRLFFRKEAGNVEPTTRLRLKKSEVRLDCSPSFSISSRLLCLFIRISSRARGLYFFGIQTYKAEAE